MFNIGKFAQDIAGGTYDHILPRETNKTSLTMRQIAAQYPTTIHNADRDVGCTCWWVGWLGAVVGASVSVTVMLSQWVDWPSLVVAAVMVGVVSFLCFGAGMHRMLVLRKPYSSQKLVVAQEALLTQLESDLNVLAGNLDFGGYKGLAGYERKKVAAMALDAGATMAATIRKTMNSDDFDDRQASARVSQELDAFHALLDRLDLQPNGGYPAYGRRAAELGEVTEEAA